MFIAFRRNVLLSALGAGLLLPALLTAAPLTIDGRIQDATGEPVVAARVELRPQFTSYERGISDLVDWMAVEVIASTRSDRRGHFRLTSPAPGPYEVWVTAKGFMPVRHELFPLVRATQLPAVKLVKSRSLLVRVVDPLRQPIAGARVAMGYRRRNSRPSWEVATQRGVADSAGKVHLSRSEKSPRVLVARAPGFSPSLPVPLWTESRAVTLRLGVAALRTVAVRDQQGRPLAGVLARVWSGYWPEGRFWGGYRPAAPVGDGYWPAGVSDEAGVLEFWAPAGDTAKVWLSSEEGRSLLVTVPVTGMSIGSSTAATQAESAKERPPRKAPQVVTLPAVTWLAGRVVEAKSQRPLAGAFVFQNGRAAKFVLSDAQGRFRLSAALAGEPFVTAVKAGYTLGDSRAALVAGEEYEELELGLEATTHIEGRVVDEQGRPVSGVLVSVPPEWVRAGSGGWPQSSSTYSNSEGRFRLDSLRFSRYYRLNVQHPKFVSLLQLVTIESGGPTSVELVLPVGHLAFGTVVDQDEIPVAGAKVRLIKWRVRNSRQRVRFYALRKGESLNSGDSRCFINSWWPEEVLSVLTDARGRFEIADLVAGHFDMVVNAAGFSTSRVLGNEVPVQAGKVDLGTVRLESWVALEGWVVDPEGEPLAGATVKLGESESGYRDLELCQIEQETTRVNSPQREEMLVVTDDAGFFSLPKVRNGSRAQLEVALSGFASKKVRGSEAPSTEPLTVVLVPSSRIAGRVLDVDGKPVSGAQVQVADSWPTGRMAFATRGRTLTDKGGSFELADLAPGTVNLKIEAEGYRPVLKLALELSPGRSLAGIELVLERGATIVGRVTTTSGEPVAGAKVGLALDDGFSDLRPFSGPGSSATDAGGNYRLESVALGLASVEVTSSLHLRAVKDLRVRAGENRLDLVLESGFEVSGRVVDSTGGPVHGAYVRLDSRPSRDESTAADGSFTLAGVTNGTYRLRASRWTQGWAELRDPIEVSGANVGGIELRLTEGTRISGRLLGLELEEPGEVTIGAYSQAGWWTQGEVVYEGRYRISGLIFGEWSEWRVTASHAPSGKQATELVVIGDGQKEVTRDLEFGGGLTLSGVVVFEDEPIARQHLSLRLAQTPVGGGKTDQNGQFKFSGLKKGQYQLILSASRVGRRHFETVELTADREIRIEIAATVVRGTVVDATDGSALAEVTVSAWSVDEIPILYSLKSSGGGVLSGERGQFNLGEFTTGRWRVVAHKEGFEQAEVEIEVSNSPIADLRLAMQPGGGLTFFVKGGRGGPVGSAGVTVADPTGRLIVGGTYATREAGRVYVAGVPRGQWELLVQSGDSAVASAHVVVPGPAPTLYLTLGAKVVVTVPELVAEGGSGQLRLLGADGRPFLKPRGIARVLVEFPVTAGRASLTGLPPGNWRAVVTTADGQTWSGSFTALAGQTVQVRLD